MKNSVIAILSNNHQKNNLKRIFLLEPYGPINNLWLYKYDTKSWQQLVPTMPLDLAQNKELYYYHKIEYHCINKQQDLLLVGYQESGIIDLWIYHVDDNNLNKLDSIMPESVNDDFGDLTVNYYFSKSKIMQINEQEKLVVLIYSTSGFNLYSYDYKVNILKQLATNASWHDPKVWAQPKYYTTMQLQIIKSVDHQEKLLLLGRNGSGIKLCCYEPQYDNWKTLIDGPLWSDTSGWDQPYYYATIQTQVVAMGEHQNKLLLLGRSKEGIIMYGYDLQANKWDKYQDISTAAFGDDSKWNEYKYYTSIQSQIIKDHNGQEQLVLFGRNNISTYLYKYDTTHDKWAALAKGPDLTDLAQHQAITMQIRTDANEIFILSSSNKHSQSLYRYQLQRDAWFGPYNLPISLIEPNNSWLDESNQQTMYLKLCEGIKENNPAKMRAQLKQGVDLFYGLELEIIADQYSLYLIKDLDETKLGFIDNNAIILLDNNNVYFIKNGKLEKDALYQPKVITIADRLGIAKVNSDQLIKYSQEHKKLIELVLAKIQFDRNIINSIANLSIKYYELTPLGLILNLADQELAILLMGILFEKVPVINPSLALPRHVANYFYMAAQGKNQTWLLLVKNLLNLCVNLGVVINLKPNLTEQLCQHTQKDFFEIAINNSDNDFIHWILTEVAIKYQLFKPEAKHLHLAVKLIQPNIVNQLLPILGRDLQQLQSALIEKCFDLPQKVSCLEYMQKNSKHNEDAQAIYTAITTFIFTKTLEQRNNEIFVWLLKYGIWIDQEVNDFALQVVIKNIDAELDLISVGLKTKNFGLIKKLFLYELLTLIDFVNTVNNNNVLLDRDFYDNLHGEIAASLQNISMDATLWFELRQITIDAAQVKSWDLLKYLPAAHFHRCIELLYNFHLTKKDLLQGFLYFITQNNLVIVDRFLKLRNASIVNYLLHGNFEQTALIIACEHKYAEMIKLLLEHMQLEQINKQVSKPHYYEDITAVWICYAFKFTKGISLLTSKKGLILSSEPAWHYNYHDKAPYSCKELALEHEKRIVKAFTTSFNHRNADAASLATLAATNQEIDADLTTQALSEPKIAQLRATV